MFAKNSERFLNFAGGTDNNNNNLAKPILTKQFENKWAHTGENVTFTCEAQIDALPVFLFYKLDRNILDEYDDENDEDDDVSLLDRHAKSLQNKNALSFYETTDRRVSLERREHTLDSSHDPLADFETINLKITRLVDDDTGYYLCIVANSVSSFRVTYAFLNVTPLQVPPPQTQTVNTLVQNQTQESVAKCKKKKN